MDIFGLKKRREERVALINKVLEGIQSTATESSICSKCDIESEMYEKGAQQFKDMHFTEEEQKFVEEIGVNPLFSIVIDKLQHRIARTMLGRSSYMVVDDLHSLQGQNLMCKYILDIFNPKKEEDSVNPLTGEVVTKAGKSVPKQG